MENSNELLLHIYENSDMGVKSTKKLLNIIKNKDNKIKSLLESELKEYESFLKKSKSLLKESKIKPNHKIIPTIMANFAMETEIEKDNTDSKIANILTRGFVMGRINMAKKVEDYKKDSSRCILKLAKASLEFQDNQIEKLKEFI